MSSVADEDGMAKRATQAADARTTDRTNAHGQAIEVSARESRRRWTAEQKRQIVAEGMEPDVSAAMVAGRHASAQDSSMLGGSSCCCAERSMPAPTPSRIWRASM